MSFPFLVQMVPDFGAKAGTRSEVLSTFMEFKYVQQTMATLIIFSLATPLLYLSYKRTLNDHENSVKQEQLHFISYDNEITDGLCANALSLFHFSRGEQFLRVYGLEESERYSKETPDVKF